MMPYGAHYKCIAAYLLENDRLELALERDAASDFE